MVLRKYEAPADPAASEAQRLSLAQVALKLRHSSRPPPPAPPPAPQQVAAAPQIAPQQSRPNENQQAHPVTPPRRHLARRNWQSACRRQAHPPRKRRKRKRRQQRRADAAGTTAPPVSGSVDVNITHQRPPPGVRLSATATGDVNLSAPRTEQQQLHPLPDPTPAVLGTQGNSLAVDQSSSSWLASSWWEQLQPGSWRGVGFVMDTAETKAGRRTSVHEYPYRDSVWVEDLGRLPRRFAFTAYLTGDDVYSQRNNMLQACEQAGPGTLVHPTFGSVECVLLDFTAADRRERGRYVEISLVFVVSGDLLFPVAGQATGSQVNGYADALDDASAQDFSASVASLQRVPQLSTQALPQWSSLAVTAVNDPARALASVAGLQGYYGRYSAGRMGALQPIYRDRRNRACRRAIASREGVLAAAAALNLAASLRHERDPPGARRRVQRRGASGCCRLIGGNNRPGRRDPPVATAVPVATDAVARDRARYGQPHKRRKTPWPRTCAALPAPHWRAPRPSTSRPRNRTRRRCGCRSAALLDAEATICADAGRDASFAALRDLRAAVALDLAVRGANLASLVEITTLVPMPSLAEAWTPLSGHDARARARRLGRPAAPAVYAVAVRGAVA